MLSFFSTFFHGKNINPDLVVWNSTRQIVQYVLQKPKECKICIERVVERGTVAKITQPDGTLFFLIFTYL